MHIIFQIIISVIIVYIIHNAILKYRKFGNDLPGPLPLPIIGNLHAFTDLPHRDMAKMTKTYGHIFRVWFADVYTVIVSDPILIREMYVDNSDIFINRIKKPSVGHGTFYHGTVTSNGDDWKRNRDIVSRAMRKTNIKHIYDLLDIQIDSLINSMKSIEGRGESFDTRYYVTKFTMAAMFKYIFNEEVGQDEDINTGEIQRLMKPMSEVFQNAGRGSFFDVLNITQPLYLLYLETFDKSMADILSFLREKYQKHLKTYDPEVSRDLLDILIKEYGTETEDEQLSILATINDFLLAGVDTSSTALESAILMLTNHPEIQEKVYDEIKNNLNGRTKVKLSDRQSMPFLIAVIKETLRFKPMSPFGLPRSASHNCYIGKYFIPKDAQILINYQALSTNELYYENPYEFNPSRFLNGEYNLAFLPFSIGARNCVGQEFAMSEMFLCLSNMLLNFKFKSIDGNKIDETESYGLTLKTKTRFNLTLEKRV